MNAARQAYRQSLGASWSRIDMLLALYGKTIKTLEDGIACLEKQDFEGLIPHRLMMYRCVTTLLEGIDVSQGEIAVNMQRLWVFIFQQISKDDIIEWKAALRIAVDINQSFQQIREEALQFENDNKSSRLENSANTQQYYC